MQLHTITVHACENENVKVKFNWFSTACYTAQWRKVERGHSRHLKRGHLDSEHAPDSSRCFPFKILRIFAPAASKSGWDVCFVKDRTAQQWHWRGRLRRHRDWISKILQQLVRHCNWDQISTASWKMALSSVVVGTKDLEERWEVHKVAPIWELLFCC